MNVIVCIKHVPDLAEAELDIDGATRRLDVEDLDREINEWDNFAVEAAVRLKEEHGARVTAITVGNEEAEEVLRRALAMGADEALHVCDDAFEDADPFTLATVLHAALRDRPCDLVLCGAISADGSSGHVGGMLAGLLDVPQVALATGLELRDGKLAIRHEVEGGLEREVELDLPALVTVQTGINEPRYVSIRGIRKVADVDVPALSSGDLGLAALERCVDVEEMFLPPVGEGAEMLEGGVEDAVEQLVERLHVHGGL